MIFDTLKVSQKLRENGRFTEDQAVALTEAFSAGSIDNLATKSDIAELRTEIVELRGAAKTDIANLRTELKGDLNQLRTEFKGDLSQLRTELKGDLGQLRTECEHSTA